MIYDCCNCINGEPPFSRQTDFPGLKLLLDYKGKLVLMSSKLGHFSYFYPQATMFTLAFEKTSQGRYTDVVTFAKSLNHFLASVYKTNNIEHDLEIIQLIQEDKIVCQIFQCTYFSVLILLDSILY